MSDWRETTGRPASFRGVPFQVEGVELEGGRRGALHEFPKRDVPYREDLGRRARAFPIEAYVLGDEYIAERDALLAALETEGPGELVHPYYGTRRVAVENFRLHEGPSEGGVARFSIIFIETEVAPSFPAATVSGQASVSSSAAGALSALASVTGEAGTSGLPTSAIASAAAVVSSASSALQTALAPVLATAAELAALKVAVGALIVDAALLARTPATALSRVLAVFDSLPTLPYRSGIAALLQASAFEASVERPPETTATRVEERALYDLLARLFRTAFVVKAAELAPLATYDSWDDALAVREDLADALDAQAEDADDATFNALSKLRADLTLAVPGADSELPKILRYTPPTTVPSLVLAHRLYGNLDREADLVTRNSVAHPGFVLGGRELEVLSDA